MAVLEQWLRKVLGTREEPGPRLSSPHRHKPLTGPQSFAEHNNNFAVAMYKQLRQRTENLLFSPFSVRTALGMALIGARGETATQMKRTLCIPLSDEMPHSASAKVIQRLNSVGGGGCEMAVANSLWGQDGASIESEFLELIAQHYGGEMHVVDFRRTAENARVTMNQWVEDKTRRKIRELIAPGGVDADTRLVLMNAVYFMGTWVLKFERVLTQDEPFYVESKDRVKVPLMHQLVECRYLRATTYQAVELDYRGSDLSMLVILPKRKSGLQDLEKKLSAQMLHECVAQLDTQVVDLFLPRFRNTWGAVDLGGQLRALGMPLAFTPFKADFSGINGHEPPDEESLFISAVFHKAFVEVNEKGTEAAAATAFTVAPTAARGFSMPERIPVFRADHPFLFAIRDRKTGTIIFLGRLADPRREC